ncbi:hypothetical protein VCR15J2_630001 [Vibrio coralliirubri]|nr:hypothetical protein VCR15J2_630001 [Vibrio coralliirubri]
MLTLFIPVILQVSLEVPSVPLVISFEHRFSAALLYLMT